MGSCAGSPQGSWTPASGPLGPQHLEEPAFCCGCWWGPPAYPCSPHPRVSRDPQGCPRSATRICGAHPGPRRPHAAVRGLAQPGARIQAWPGPWGWIPLVFVLGLGGGAQITPAPQSPGPGQPRSLWVRGWCPVQGVLPSRRDSGRRQGTVGPLHHSPAPTLLGAPCLPSSLQPLGTLWDTQASDGSRVSKEPRGG